MIYEKNFGKDYTLYTIESKNGIKVSVTDLGATVQSIATPDRNGVFGDVVLGYDSAEEYLANGDYLGATIGRYANRIGGAKFSIDGTEYRITANEGRNTLHGGVGFDKKKFDVVCKSDNAITFAIVSPDGDDGFPGNVKVSVSFCLNDENALEICYTAVSDRDTVLNLTNHSYFNLRGEGKVLEHELRLNADCYTPVDEEQIPTGEVRSVEGTDFDFRSMRKIEKDFYDHNFVLNGDGLCAEVFEPASGRTMFVTTDMPGVQFYAAAWLTERNGKNGAVYGKNSALCLETQFFPDSPNRPEFPSCLLKKGEVFSSKTVYKFGVK